MVKYRECLRKGLLFGVSPARWLQVFAVDMAFFSLFVELVLSNAALTSSFLAVLVSPAGIVDFSGMTGVALLGVMWFLCRLWIAGAVIHQAHREGVRQSWRAGLRRLPSLVAVMVVVLVLTMVVAGLVPLFSNAVAVLVWVGLYFSLQAVMVKKRPAVAALRDSWSLFVGKFNRVDVSGTRFLGWVLVAALLGAGSFWIGLGSAPQLPLTTVVSFWISVAFLAFLLFHSEVFRVWLLVSAVSGAITLLFAAPGFYVAFSQLPVQVMLGGQSSILPAIVLYYLTNLEMLLLAGAVFIAGSSLATAFALKAQTEFYLQFRKRFGLF